MTNIGNFLDFRSGVPDFFSGPIIFTGDIQQIFGKTDPCIPIWANCNKTLTDRMMDEPTRCYTSNSIQYVRSISNMNSELFDSLSKTKILKMIVFLQVYVNAYWTCPTLTTTLTPLHWAYPHTSPLGLIYKKRWAKTFPC